VEERTSEEGYTASQGGVDKGREGVQGLAGTSRDSGNDDSVINVAECGRASRIGRVDDWHTHRPRRGYWHAWAALRRLFASTTIRQPL